MFRSLHFFKHAANIERPSIAIDVTVIRDRRTPTWSTVAYSVPCYFEDAGATMIRNQFFGQAPIGRYTVYFEGDVDVRINDRLKKDGSYYVVEGVHDFGSGGQDFQRQATVRLSNYTMEH